jgi:hypothetical protein
MIEKSPVFYQQDTRVDSEGETFGQGWYFWDET